MKKRYRQAALQAWLTDKIIVAFEDLNNRSYSPIRRRNLATVAGNTITSLYPPKWAKKTDLDARMICEATRDAFDNVVARGMIVWPSSIEQAE